MQVNPYLVFPGNCEEAFRYYEKALDGKIEFIMRNSEAPADSRMPGGDDKIIHAALRLGDQLILASDSPPEYFQPMQGHYVSLSVDSTDDADRIYKALADNAKIQMELGETFWSPKFAMLIDRFGTPWMINTNPKEA